MKKKLEEEAIGKRTYIDRYNEIVIEDENEVEKISSIAADRLQHIFNLHFCRPETKSNGDKVQVPDNRIPLIIFTETYDAVIDKLIDARKGMLARNEIKEYNKFNFNFANRFEIGYDNISNDEDEKEGNYMIYIKDIRESRTIEEPAEPNTKPTEKAVEWISQNITQKPQTITEIAIDAKERLKKLDLALHSHELVMPIFCTVYDTMVEYMDMRRIELNECEYEINFAGAFFVCAMENEDGGSDIIFRPSIDSKTSLKDDASSGY